MINYAYSKNIKKEDLLDTVTELYGKTLPQLSEVINVKNTTLHTWKNGKISNVGEVVLRLLIENFYLTEKDEAVKKIFSLYSTK